MNWFARRVGDGGDRGSALVAAVAVAIIGIALSLVVMTRALVVTNDTQRDRVRTAEIHSAEGALDSALFELESELLCHAPSFSPIVVGEGTSAVEVTITYQYFNGTTELTACDGTLIAGEPTRALVSARAVPVVDTVAGVAPVRTIEAMVELVPVESMGEQTAIFAANSLTTTNPITLESEDSTLEANIRIEGLNAHWRCQSGGTIKGNVIVVQGSATFEVSSCRVTGDLWVKNNFTGKQPIGGGLANIGGDLTARYGTIELTNANYRFGGNVRAGGNTVGFHWGTAQWAGTRCSANTTPCASSVFGADPVVVGIPEIDYKSSDWTGAGYTIKSKTTFEDEWISQANTNAQWQIDQIRNANCTIGPWMFYNGAQPTLNLNGGSTLKTKSVYDLRTCQFAPQGITFKLYADTAIFTKSMITNGQTRFQSGDGQPHNLYIIVPDGGTANNGKAECSDRGTYKPGDITLQTGVFIDPGIVGMYYTPCTLGYTNPSSTIGQLYGGNIDIRTNNGFKFVPLTVPGVELGVGTTTSEGVTVRVQYKHETRE
jgi:hypothetical protein